MARVRPARQLFHLLLAFLPATAVLLSLVPSADTAPAVAFVSSKFIYLEDYDVVNDFREAGFEVGALAWKAVTAEALQAFNAIVLTDIPGANERGELPEAIAPAAGTRAAPQRTWFSNRGTSGCWMNKSPIR